MGSNLDWVNLGVLSASVKDVLELKIISKWCMFLSLAFTGIITFTALTFKRCMFRATTAASHHA